MHVDGVGIPAARGHLSVVVFVNVFVDERLMEKTVEKIVKKVEDDKEEKHGDDCVHERNLREIPNNNPGVPSKL